MYPQLPPWSWPSFVVYVLLTVPSAQLRLKYLGPMAAIIVKGISIIYVDNWQLSRLILLILTLIIFLGSW